MTEGLFIGSCVGSIITLIALLIIGHFIEREKSDAVGEWQKWFKENDL